MDPVRWTDKVSAVATAVTALATIVVPIGAFLWLNPAIQGSLVRKQLLVSEAIADSNFQSPPYAPVITWTIVNPGRLFAEDVVIEVRSTNQQDPNPLRSVGGLTRIAISAFVCHLSTSMLQLAATIG
jgi:hypothetical protein